MSSFIKTDDHITFSTTGADVVTVPATHPNFNRIVKFVKAGLWNQAMEISQPARMIESHGDGKIRVDNGVVYYGNIPLHNTLTNRIVRMFEEGFDVDPMLRFLENLMQNPSKNAILELYDFLAYGQLPITSDGHFLAYKRVNNNYTDVRTGRFNNAPGALVEEDRSKVCDDKTRTCARGLHFCSYEYLSHYPGERIVVLKINPRDVVSIPVDYNNTKGRCCRYRVLRDLSEMGDMHRSVYVGAVKQVAGKQYSGEDQSADNSSDQKLLT